jgi:hypothetical protein
MKHKTCSVCDPAETSEPCLDVAATPIDGSEQQSCCPRLFSPADPLTRLMMKADGVTEAYLDALLRKIAIARH